MRVGTLILVKLEGELAQKHVLDVAGSYVMIDRGGQPHWISQTDLCFKGVVSAPTEADVSDDGNVSIYVEDDIDEEYTLSHVPVLGERVQFEVELDGADLEVTGYVIKTYKDSCDVVRVSCTEYGSLGFKRYWEVPVSRLKD